MTAAPAPWNFVATPKVPGTGRSVPLEETAARTRAVLPKIPVTRIADLTPLDTIGLPVYSACTPLARDLTLHLGKGADAASARMSAVMEAIERASAEAPPEGVVVRASYRELCERAGPVPIAPESFELPTDTTFRDDRPFDWMPAYDLLQRAQVLMPVDAAINPPREGLLLDADTNGLASGNVHLEAVVHGLCEVIERDCVSQIDFGALFAHPEDERPETRAIDLQTLPARALEWVTRSQEGGLEFLVHEITSDLMVPSYRAYVLDHLYPGPRGHRTMVFFGMGTHPSSEVAVLRSITEAIQARLGFIQGARDSFNVGRARSRAATHMNRLRRLMHGKRAAFVQTPLEGDILADLETLLSALRRAGTPRCLVADLTRRDLGIPVVRVRVPGLSAFCLNMRRFGPRCTRWLL